MSSCTFTTIHGNKNVTCQEVSFSISSLDYKAQFEVVNGISLVHPDMPRRSFNLSELKRNWPFDSILILTHETQFRLPASSAAMSTGHLMSSKCTTLPKDPTALVPRKLFSDSLLSAKFLTRPHLLFSRLVSPSTCHKTVSMSWSENPIRSV
jgi:hypothetical protein